ncbi:MAG: hypothetical protein OXC92_05955 [Flavobacteriaceae bacterium]|nr:hypothetical protein [Flavobacteriaceae bacterium]MCY4216508.1 hypothetical protein [Flavobacteriaceae bacterium]MCY4254186.1 hypothetical protein [Flavobacteriaceae bacterium]
MISLYITTLNPYLHKRNSDSRVQSNTTNIFVLGRRLSRCAIIDRYRGFVIGFDVSNTMPVDWCSEVFYKAMERYGCPLIWNTNRGIQWTSKQYTSPISRFSLSSVWRVKQERRAMPLSNDDGIG